MYTCTINGAIVMQIGTACMMADLFHANKQCRNAKQANRNQASFIHLTLLIGQLNQPKLQNKIKKRKKQNRMF